MKRRTEFFREYRKLARLLESGAVFTAFDTETTGLVAESGRILEIGAVKFTGGGTVAAYQTLVNPGCAIPREASAVNHISDGMVADCPPAAAVLPEFMDFIGGTILVAHNARFDVNFITAELERAGMRPLRNTVIDTLGLCRWAYPSLGKYSLHFLAEKMGIEQKDAHRAGDDARVCREILLRCVRDTASVQIR